MKSPVKNPTPVRFRCQQFQRSQIREGSLSLARDMAVAAATAVVVVVVDVAVEDAGVANLRPIRRHPLHRSNLDAAVAAVVEDVADLAADLVTKREASRATRNQIRRLALLRIPKDFEVDSSLAGVSAASTQGDKVELSLA